MIYKLGRNPSPHGAVQFRYLAIFNPEELPTPPPVFGHRLGLEWGMLANDNAGDCVVAGGMHETMIWTREWAERAAPFTDAVALQEYSFLSGYVPGDESTDTGLDMAMAASYRRQTGLIDANGVRHKVDAYLRIDPKNFNALMQATYLFGAIGLGIEFPDSAGRQFDAEVPWMLVRNSPVGGGHYIPCVGRNSHGHALIVTWGRIHAASPDFITTYCDEAIVYLSLEHLNQRGFSPEGYDQARLKAMLNSLPKRRT